MFRWAKILIALLSTYLLLAVIAGVVVGEGSLKPPRRALVYHENLADEVHRRYRATLEAVALDAQDGAVLRAWYIQPQLFRGSAVILLHGLGDNREGVAGYSKLFLDHGYAVLLPDARAHGESGGNIATYGLKESDDIQRWVSWLYAHELLSPHCVYGFGESYGAALILESLAMERRFCAVAVEGSFSTASEMSYERVSGPFHLAPWFGRTILRPAIVSAELYARTRYGIDLLRASPRDALEHSRVPVLLIHGERDQNISPRHSMILAKAAPDHVELWLVPNAGHGMAWSTVHQEFESRVLGWFNSHQGALLPTTD